MALFLRASVSAFASSASPTITIPAATLGGDGLYLLTAGGWTPPASAPAGWTLLSAPVGQFWQWAVYTKTASGTYGAASPDASTVVTLNYSNGPYDVQTSMFVVGGSYVQPYFNYIYDGTVTAATRTHTAIAGELMLYWGTARPNTPVTITLSSGTTDTTRAADANSGSVIGHEVIAVAGSMSQTFTPSTAGTGSRGRAYVMLGLAIPFDDTFANAQAITTPTSFDGLDTTTWGTEALEPGSMDRTGWATFTPPATSTYTISTVGSSFDTLLAVYTGTALNNLVLVASDDNSGGSGTSLMNVALTAATTYYIQVGAQPGGAGGMLSFTMFEKSAPRLAALSTEALTNSASTPARRLAALSAEAITDSASIPQRRLGGITVEVLTPAKLVFIGWGTPL